MTKEKVNTVVGEKPATKDKSQPLPHSGGSYLRNKETGELTRVKAKATETETKEP